MERLRVRCQHIELAFAANFNHGFRARRHTLTEPYLYADKIVFDIGIWVHGDFGGHKENPINSASLILEADKLLRQLKPHIFKRIRNTNLICPLDIAEKMRWPANGKPRVPGDAEPCKIHK
jgi:hypothetical protein